MSGMTSLPFTFTDGGVVAIILLSGFFAFFRGFVREFLAIGAWIGAIFATLHGLEYAQRFALIFFKNKQIAEPVAALVLFLVSLVTLSIVFGAISRRVRDSQLSALDRSLGFLFGLARGAVMVCLALLVLSWAMPDCKERPVWLTTFRSLEAIEAGAEWLAKLLPEDTASQVRRVASLTCSKVKGALEFNRLVNPQPKPNPQPAGARQGYDRETNRSMGDQVRQTAGERK